VCAADSKLDDAMLFPVLERRYPEPEGRAPPSALKLLPKSMAALNSGGRLRILAWGDSVTDAGYLPDADNTRWQAQFVRRLRARFPQADIELISEAWGGRNTGSYFNEPPGSRHNYQERVLDLKPDLVISEFVNDAGLNEAGVYERYGRIRDDFKAIGAEWIILTPHYVRPDWMGLESQKGIDDDPRAYVKAVRKFGSENGIAVAEGSLRYGRLWRQGIPYLTLMMNNINHPDPCGMSLFADALMELFP
jgi:lysophospholipase L1-like esterase